MATTDVLVTDNSAESQFKARIGDQLAGVVEYRLTDDRITFTHTRVFDDFAGKGVGGALARQALDAVRADGTRKVVPECSFIAGWLDKHPDYQDLEAEGARPASDEDDD